VNRNLKLKKILQNGGLSFIIFTDGFGSFMFCLLKKQISVIEKAQYWIGKRQRDIIATQVALAS
jgi:hypothetical protein